MLGNSREKMRALVLANMVLAAGCGDDSQSDAAQAGTGDAVAGTSAAGTEGMAGSAPSGTGAPGGTGAMAGSTSGIDPSGSGGGESTDPFAGERGSFTDPRDGQAYPWVRVGEQVWFARNLSFSPSGDPIVDEQNGASTTSRVHTSADAGSEPQRLGTYYQWEAAMADDLTLAKQRVNGRDHVRGVCPEGWRIPAYEDFQALTETIDALLGPFPYDNRRWEGLAEVVKSPLGWSQNPGTDDLGLSILPSGWMEEPGAPINFARASGHWTSNLGADDKPYYLSLSSESQTFALIDFRSGQYYPIRCLLDR